MVKDGGPKSTTVERKRVNSKIYAFSSDHDVNFQTLEQYSTSRRKINQNIFTVVCRYPRKKLLFEGHFCEFPEKCLPTSWRTNQFCRFEAFTMLEVAEGSMFRLSYLFPSSRFILLSYTVIHKKPRQKAVSENIPFIISSNFICQQFSSRKENQTTTTSLSFWHTSNKDTIV